MMIDEEDYYGQKGIYHAYGKLWRVSAYCPEPSITVKCIQTGEKLNFGTSGHLNEDFRKLSGIEYNHNTETLEIT